MTLTDWLLICIVYIVLDNTVGAFLYGFFHGTGGDECSHNKQ